MGAPPPATKAISSVRPMGPLVSRSTVSPTATSSKQRGSAPRGCSASTCASILATSPSLQGWGSVGPAFPLLLPRAVPRSKLTTSHSASATSSPRWLV